MASVIDSMQKLFSGPALMLAHGESGTVVYFDADGAEGGLAITAMLGPEEQPPEGENTLGETSRRVRTCTINLSPTGPGGGVADPGPEDEIEIDGVRWNIDRVEQLCGGMARLRLVALAQSRISGAGVVAR